MKPLREYLICSDGSQWTRRRVTDEIKGEHKWARVEVLEEKTEPERRYLVVVAENQAPGEPKHWSLFTYKFQPRDQDTAPGRVWQVTGDAEFMHFETREHDDLLNSASLSWYEVVNADLSDMEIAVVDKAVREETPPSAPSRAAVTENCQGWTMRVLMRLAASGVVKAEVFASLRDRMDPLK